MNPCLRRPQAYQKISGPFETDASWGLDFTGANLASNDTHPTFFWEMYSRWLTIPRNFSETDSVTNLNNKQALLGNGEVYSL